MKITKDEAVADVESAVISATSFIETLESGGYIVGNGWHIRQTIGKFAADTISARWKEPKHDTDAAKEGEG
jgi:hypothetical protein